MKKIFGILVIIYGVWFGFKSTDYFGHNLFPESQEEWVTDITTIIIVLCGLIIVNENPN